MKIKTKINFKNLTKLKTLVITMVRGSENLLC